MFSVEMFWMNEKRFRVNDLVKFNYSEVGEYVDENHTDRPLRNDEVVDLLNEYLNEIQKLNKVIDLMEYQMKVQDRIIKEYEDGD